MKEYVIIIGSMKSGTTTLFDLLSRHPRIASALNKEPGYFAFPEVWEQGEEWYEDLFGFDPDRHRYRMEASTDYTKFPFVDGVWERMTEDPGRRFKLVYIMRHPLRRIESHSRHVQGTRKELGQRLSDRPDHGLDTGLSEVNLAVARYAEQLDQFSDARGSGNLFLLTLEDLRSEPERLTAELCQFLELDPAQLSAELPRSNVAGEKRVTSPLWERLTSVRPALALGKALLPQKLRRLIRGRLSQHKLTVEGRFTLTAEEETDLLRLLQDDLLRLRDHYGLDVERVWGIPLPANN